MNSQELRKYLLKEIEELQQLVQMIPHDLYYEGQLAEAKKILGYLDKHTPKQH